MARLSNFKALFKTTAGAPGIADLNAQELCFFSPATGEIEMYVDNDDDTIVHLMACKINRAAGDPGVTNDIDEGYTPGSIWVNTTSDEAFICMDNANGAAVWTSISAAGSGISNVVEDLSPQLGADLDANAFDILFDTATGIRDENDNEQLIFVTTASAVNYFQITNAAAAGDPALAVAGTDIDINLNLVAKGTGVVQANGVEVLTLTGTQSPTNKTFAATTDTWDCGTI